MVCRLVILEWILLLDCHRVNGRWLVAGRVVRQAFRIEDDLGLLFIFRVILVLLAWNRQHIAIAVYRRRLDLRHRQARIILFMFIAHCLLIVSLRLDINLIIILLGILPIFR